MTETEPSKFVQVAVAPKYLTEGVNVVALDDLGKIWTRTVFSDGSGTKWVQVK